MESKGRILFKWHSTSTYPPLSVCWAQALCPCGDQRQGHQGQDALRAAENLLRELMMDQVALRDSAALCHFNVHNSSAAGGHHPDFTEKETG